MEAAREAIVREQRRQAKFYDRQIRQQLTITVGLLVWVSKFPKGPDIFKFQHLWRGPARIVKPACFDNYRVPYLDTCDDNIVHASMLLPYHSTDATMAAYARDLRMDLRDEDRAVGSATPDGDTGEAQSKPGDEGATAIVTVQAVRGRGLAAYGR